jgi:3-phenylpropionate/trans-cinnamate dioxygenase ferredoxin component
MTALKVCALVELSDGTARRIEHGGHKICVVRCGDEVYAIGDTCSHAEVSLSEGEIFCAEREIECWKHGSTFSLTTGAPQTLPATVPVPVYTARVDNGDVIVEVDA